jgi:spermidine synthase
MAGEYPHPMRGSRLPHGGETLHGGPFRRSMMKSKAAVWDPSHRLAGLVLVCFFLSGLTGLIYQIIWMRLISRLIGGAPFSVSAILVVFMGGLGLGSYIASRKADRFQGLKLVRVYGTLELAIGIYALFVPLLLMLSKGFYAVLYNNLYEHTLFYNLFIFAGALLVLGIPTICMGATLPILCKFYVGSLAHLGTHAGRLYGLNTIGAALGALVCGFWMINALGVWGTMLAAIAINCAIGVLCLSISPKAVPGGRERAPAVAERPKKAPPAETPSTPARCSPAAVTGALLIFMISGFCAMAYEVLWTKLLGLIVGPTTYSFTIVLVTFIVGLALGNLVFGRWADKTRDALGLLVASQIVAAFFALGVSQFFGNSQLFFAKLIDSFSDHFALLSLAKAVVLFGFMVLPTFFIGATFPLVAKIYTRSLASVGRSIGIAYAINTIGAVLGSFCAGFILIPLVGKENGLRLVIALQLVTAMAVGAVVLQNQKAGTLRRAALAAALVAGVVLYAAYPSWNRLVLATGKYHRFEEAAGVAETIARTGWLRSLFAGARILAATERGELVYYGDGIGGFTTVLKYPGPFGEAEFSMANSGKMDASSRGDMKTQTLLAHFPLLFAGSPEKVMVLGLASGVTGGEVLHYPVRQLDVIDINDRVFEASRFFEPWNNHVLTDARTRLIVQDAMAHLALTRTTYDVIISEPSNPWMAGMAALFTRDFFEVARSRLTDDGIYVQWFHCYQMDWPTFALIGRTFAEVFPNSLLVSCEPGGLSRDFLFVGFKGSAGLNWDHARHNIRYAQRSANIDLAAPELFHRLIVSEDLEGLFGHGPINTDDRPLLEYAAPKLMYRDEAAQHALLQQLAGRAWLGPATQSAVQRLRQSVDAQIDFAAYALSVHSPFPDMVDLARAAPDQKERFEMLLLSYGARNPVDFDLIEDRELARRLRAVQIAAIQDNLPAMPRKAPAHLYLAWLLAEEGMAEEAIAHYHQGIALAPGDARAHNDLGFLLYQTGDIVGALAQYETAARLRPDFLLALGNMAFAYLELDQLNDALYYFKETLRVQPDIAESHYYAGHILSRQGNLADAAGHFRQALLLARESGSEELVSLIESQLQSLQ